MKLYNIQIGYDPVEKFGILETGNYQFLAKVEERKLVVVLAKEAEIKKILNSHGRIVKLEERGSLDKPLNFQLNGEDRRFVEEFGKARGVQ